MILQHEDVRSLPCPFPCWFHIKGSCVTSIMIVFLLGVSVLVVFWVTQRDGLLLRDCGWLWCSELFHDRAILRLHLLNHYRLPPSVYIVISFLIHAIFTEVLKLNRTHTSLVHTVVFTLSACLSACLSANFFRILRRQLANLQIGPYI